MSLRDTFRAAALGFSTVVAAGASVGLDMPSSFIPRCQTDELRLQPGISDPCRKEFAVLGLNGPTVLSESGADVETTGSLKPAAESRGKGAD